MRRRATKVGMQPWETIGRAVVAGGTELVLARRGDEWVVRNDGRVLMSSRQHGSEDALATLALDRVKRPGGARTVLIGGLGIEDQAEGLEALAVSAEVGAWERFVAAHRRPGPAAEHQRVGIDEVGLGEIHVEGLRREVARRGVALC